MKKSVLSAFFIPILVVFTLSILIIGIMHVYSERANESRELELLSSNIEQAKCHLESHFDYIGILIGILEKPDLQKEDSIYEYIKEIHKILHMSREDFFILIEFDNELIGIADGLVSVLSSETAFQLHHYEFDNSAGIKSLQKVNEYFDLDSLLAPADSNTRQWNYIIFGDAKYWGSSVDLPDEGANSISAIWVGISPVHFKHIIPDRNMYLRKGSELISFGQSNPHVHSGTDFSDWYSIKVSGWGELFTEVEFMDDLPIVVEIALISVSLFLLFLWIKRKRMQRQFNLLAGANKETILIKELDPIKNELLDFKNKNAALWLENKYLQENFRLANYYIRKKGIELFDEHPFFESLLDFKFFMEPSNYVETGPVSYNDLSDCIHNAAAGYKTINYKLSGVVAGLRGNLDVLFRIFSIIMEEAAKSIDVSMVEFILSQGVNIRLDSGEPPSEHLLAHLNHLASCIDGYIEWENYTYKLALSSEDFIFISPDNRAKTKERISALVLENEEITSMYIQRMLESADVRIFTATDGYEALSVLMDQNINLIITDITMPRMNGVDFAKKVRHLPRYYAVPIVALTLFTLEEDLQVYKEAGINDYIGKPLNEQEFWRIIGPYLRPSE